MTDSRAFYVFYLTTLTLPSYRESDGKSCARHRTGYENMNDISITYEHLMKEAFKCKRAEFSFVNADYQRGASKHEKEYALYVKCALIVILKNSENHQEDYLAAIELLDNEPTAATADSVIRTLSSKGIIF